MTETVTPIRALSTAKKDRTAAERQRRYRDKQKTGGTMPPVTPPVPVTAPTVTPVTPVTSRVTGGVDVAAYTAAIALAGVGVGLSALGMIETATYALAVGGVLFCALAIAADVLTLVMPSVIVTLGHRHSPAAILAALLWCAGSAVTVANLAGYVGEHVEQYQSGR